MAVNKLTDSIAERLQAAFLVGPPEEVCMVLHGNKLRHFNKRESDAIGAFPTSDCCKDWNGMPLYGKPEDGWTLVLEPEDD